MKHKYLKIGAIVIIVALVLTFILVKVRQGATVNKDENGSGVQTSGEDAGQEQQETDNDHYHDIDLEEPNGSESNGNKPNDTSHGTTNSSQQGNNLSGSDDSSQDSSSQENPGQGEQNPEEGDKPLSNGPLELPTDVFE